jgi:hypothetical protein
MSDQPPKKGKPAAAKETSDFKGSLDDLVTQLSVQRNVFAHLPTANAITEALKGFEASSAQWSELAKVLDWGKIARLQAEAMKASDLASQVQLQTEALRAFDWTSRSFRSNYGAHRNRPKHPRESWRRTSGDSATSLPLKGTRCWRRRQTPPERTSASLH